MRNFERAGAGRGGSDVGKEVYDGGGRREGDVGGGGRGRAFRSDADMFGARSTCAWV
jgi:hypothetical protein